MKLLNNAKQEEKKHLEEQTKSNKGGNSTPKIPNIVSQNIKQQEHTRRPPPKK